MLLPLFFIMMIWSLAGEGGGPHAVVRGALRLLRRAGNNFYVGLDIEEQARRRDVTNPLNFAS